MQTEWRRERDSNPRYGFPYSSFQDWRLQPLGHLSATTTVLLQSTFNAGLSGTRIPLFSIAYTDAHCVYSRFSRPVGVSTGGDVAGSGLRRVRHHSPSNRSRNTARLS